MSTASKPGGGSRASDEDSKTSVRVAVRVRPPLNPSDPGYDLIPQRFQRGMVQTTSNTSLAIDAPQGRKLFVFDRVFSSDVDQSGVWDYLSDCVNSFTQGYNVSLMAYGQSGAGKSYTMGTSGPAEQDDMEIMGVIPRAATALFEKLEGPKGNPNRASMSQLRTPKGYSQFQPSSQGQKTWSLKATYVEIYNEQLRDLLIPESVPASERGQVSIREDVKGNILLTGLRQVEINSVEDLMNALNTGSTVRQTDATAVNARSSRSHAVFSLNLVQRRSGLATKADKRMSVPIEAMTGAETWITTDSKLHFVDLAGSERLKNTGAQGERAKEGISINAGLAALGKVISQLSSRSAGSHVSYRDSRLTRLLQDSLGGNAITYMIACVTPAEFHLSETLNTVQYAQRARAIQSKPRIQQVEEGDKQAIIDRLKAEVAFLRDQVRNAERGGGDRRPADGTDRSDRPIERDFELQNQLLDAQENYNALSRRHANLIAEMAKARNHEVSENQHLEESLGETATERLNRSNTFAKAVEQVVMEYEKTIQSLEQSLGSTRSTLSNTETTLLEKETKIAYVETINTQLQARLQKLMDRETSTENYLHDLEAKLDGHTSGEEKNATIILELRKEIARIRENEATCEDYISTLEERLAEADQDADLMQREMARLEEVIERQRSLGKLDSLLYELDHIQQDNKGENESPAPEPVNGTGHRRTASRKFADHSRSQSHVSRMSHTEAIPEAEEETTEEHEVDEKPDQPDQEQEPTVDTVTPKPSHNPLSVPVETAEEYPTSPAQSKFVADKLEAVTQELIDLRVENESTLNEYDLLHAKYDEALRTLAELQDAVDEARHPNRQRDSVLSVTDQDQTRPSSFLSDARSSEPQDGKHYSSSRSLSSELSSAMESPATMEHSDAETLAPKKKDTTEAAPVAVPAVPHENGDSDPVAQELERLKAVAAEKEAAEKELAEKYSQLEQQHYEALDMMEELKTEVAKAQAAEATSPRSSAPVIRRKSSQNVMIIDRAHRSFASLRNIAAENFEAQPDVMQNFELNLNAAMHELHARSERIQELEAGVASAKKEMETKMTIISGLTRERSSLKSGPMMDMSVVSSLRDQLEKNEKQLKGLQDAHASREQELQHEVEALRESMAAAKSSAAESSSTPTEPGLAPAAAIQSAVDGLPVDGFEGAADVEHETPSETTGSLDAAHAKKIQDLKAELSTWETKHQATLATMESTEIAMKSQIAQLEAQLAKAAQTPDADEEVKAKEQQHVQSLRDEIDEYKAIINSNASRVAQLENTHAATKVSLEEALADREASSAEIHTHRELANRLESQIANHEKALEAHQQGLRELTASHSQEIEEIKASSKKEYDEQVQTLMSEHAENIRLLESELTESREDLMKVATQVAFALGLDVSVEKITERIEDLIADQKALGVEQKKGHELEAHVLELTNINEGVMRDLEKVKDTLNEMLGADGVASPRGSVVAQLAVIKKKMYDLENKNKKHSRLVDELEEQLQTNYDQHQMTNKRLSSLQTERNSQLEEATSARNRVQSELENIKEDYAQLQAKFEGIIPNLERSNSVNSQLRKSASHTSLPSPPPAIPLPPLPRGGTSSPPPTAVPSTPTGHRPASKDLAISQIHDDQEARIRTIEKHLDAEKQLTQTLEEALTDLEKQSNKVKSDCDAWKRRAQELESEIKDLKDRPVPDNRLSMHQFEEEKRRRLEVEQVNARLKERMEAVNKSSKKKKGSLNCF